MNFVLSVFAVTVFYCRTPCFPLAIHYCKSFLYSRLLYLELPKKNWFAAINFCNLNVDYLKNIELKIFEDWFTATNIHNDEAFTNITKNFPHANKSCFTILFIILFVCYRDQLLDVCGGGGRDSVHRVCGSGPVPHEVTLLSHVLQRSLALSNS